jgi:hypothetical protein
MPCATDAPCGLSMLNTPVLPVTTRSYFHDGQSRLLGKKISGKPVDNLGCRSFMRQQQMGHPARDPRAIALDPTCGLVPTFRSTVGRHPPVL